MFTLTPIQLISCHVASLPWQEPEVEFNKLLLTDVSDRDRNVDVNTVPVVSVVIFILT